MTLFLLRSKIPSYTKLLDLTILYMPLFDIILHKIIGLYHTRTDNMKHNTTSLNYLRWDDIRRY